MTSILKIAAITVASIAIASGTFAAEFTKGTVKKVDAKAKKVTIIHEELKSLEMPAMTMVFRVKDPAMLDKVKAGDKVKFRAEKVGGAFTITHIDAH